MSDKSWRIFFTVVALIIVSGVVYSAFQSITSFQELVLDRYSDTKKISYISIEKYDDRLDENQTVKITDRETMDRIMENFSDVKLVRTENYARGTEYRIWINYEYTPFSVNYTAPDHLKIWPHGSKHKRYSWTYKIVGSFDHSIIEDQFK